MIKNMLLSEMTRMVKIYRHPKREEFKMPPKIEFRYVVEFEPYVPTPESYDVEKPLEDLTNDELADMAMIDAEDAADKIEFFEPKDIYVEVIIGGTAFRRVKA